MRHLSLLPALFLILFLTDVSAQPEKQSLPENAPLWGKYGTGGPAAITADGKTIIEASPLGDGEIRVWDVETGALRGTTRLDGINSIGTVVLSPNGRYLAAGTGGVTILERSADRFDIVGRLHPRTPQQACLTAGSLAGIAFSPDGRYFVELHSNTFTLWNLLDGRPVLLPEAVCRENRALFFTPDSSRVISPRRSSDSIDILTFPELNIVRTIPSGIPPDPGRVPRMVAIPGGTTMIGSYGNGLLMSLDAATGAVRWRLTISSGSNFYFPSLAISPDGTELAIAYEDGTIEFRRAATGELVRTVKRPAGARSIAYFPDGRRLLVAGGNQGLEIIDAISGEERLEIGDGHRGTEHIVHIDRGRVVVSGGIDGIVKLWDAPSGRKLGEVTLPGFVRGLAVKGDTILAAVPVPVAGGYEAKLYMIDSRSRQIAKVIPLAGGHFHHAAFSPRGERVILHPGDSTIIIASTADGTGRVVPMGGTTGSRPIPFSPDGKRFAIIAHKPQIEIRSADDGRVLATIGRERDRAIDMAFAPDGKLAVAWGEDSTIIYDTRGRRLGGAAEKGYHRRIGISPDGRMMAIGDAGGVKLLSFPKLRLLGRYSFENGSIIHGCNDLSIDPHRRTIAFAGAGGDVVLWSIGPNEDRADSVTPAPDRTRPAGLMQDEVERYPLSSPGFALPTVMTTPSWEGTGVSPLRGQSFLLPDGDHIVTLADHLLIWDRRSGKARQLPHQPLATVIDVTADGRYIALGNYRSINLIDQATGDSIRTFSPGNDGAITFMAFSRDGEYIAAGVSFRGIYIWKTGDGTLLRHIASSSALGPVRFSPDGTLIAYSEASGGVIRIFDVATWKHRHTIAVPEAKSPPERPKGPPIEFTPDSKGIFSANNNQELFHWNVRTGKLITTIIIPQGKDYPPSMAISPDGRELAVADNQHKSVAIIDFSSGRLITSISRASPIRSVSYSADGRYLLTSGEMENPTVFDATTRKSLWEAGGGHRHQITALAHSGDGRLLASAALDDRWIIIWNIEDGRPVRLLHRYWEGSREPEPGVPIALAFSQYAGVLMVLERDYYLPERGYGTLSIRYITIDDGKYETPRPLPAEVKPAIDFATNTLATLMSDSLVLLYQLHDMRSIDMFSLGERAYILALSPDGKLLGVGFDDGTAGIMRLKDKTWLGRVRVDLGAMAEIRFVTVGGKQTLAFHLTDELHPPLATSYGPGRWALWEPGSDSLVELAIPPATDLPETGPVRMSKHRFGILDDWLVTSDNHDISVWFLPGPRLTRIIRVNRDMPAGMPFTPIVSVAPDGSSIAVGSWDGTIRLWRTLAGQTPEPAAAASP